MELLKDPKKTRVVKSLTPPPSKPLHPSLIWNYKANPSIINRSAELGFIKGAFANGRSNIEGRYDQTDQTGPEYY